jgi:hypothetical protein
VNPGKPGIGTPEEPVQELDERSERNIGDSFLAP